MSKQTVELIIRHLLGIVAALRKEYALPNEEMIVSKDDTISEARGYKSV